MTWSDYTDKARACCLEGLSREKGSQWVIPEMPVRRRGEGFKDSCSSRNKKEGPTQRDT